MGLTALQSVAWFESFAPNDWGPNTHYVNPFSKLLGRPGEFYCADAVTATLLTAGIDIRKECPGYYNVGVMHNYMLGAPATGHLGFLTIARGHEDAGDVIMYHFDGEWAHVGMVRAPHSNGQFHTIEGDTSSPAFPGSETTAGVTTKRDRNDSDWPDGTVHIFRPGGYMPPAPTHVDTGQDLNTYLNVADVETLQGILGVTRDGLAGPGTVDALEVKAGYAPDGKLDTAGSNTVKKVQVEVNLANQTDLAVDGILGPQSASAIHTYLARGGKLAGLASQPTAMPKPKPKPTPPAPKVLSTISVGSSGSLVKELQNFMLKEFSAYSGSIKRTGGADGSFGNGTKAVIEQFQSRTGLAADGVVGPKTWAKLAQYGFKA